MKKLPKLELSVRLSTAVVVALTTFGVIDGLSSISADHVARSLQQPAAQQLQLAQSQTAQRG